jgi:hypothetical protein
MILSLYAERGWASRHYPALGYFFLYFFYEMPDALCGHRNQCRMHWAATSQQSDRSFGRNLGLIMLGHGSPRK